MKEKITAWITRDKIGDLRIYNEKPYKSNYWPEWVADKSEGFELDWNLFSQVKWEDEEPTKVKLTIKICE